LALLKANRIQLPSEDGQVTALRKLGVGKHKVEVFQRPSGDRIIAPGTLANDPSSSRYKPSYCHRKLPRLVTFVNDNCENTVIQPFQSGKDSKMHIICLFFIPPQ
jgi:hypothetical protein